MQRIAGLQGVQQAQASPLSQMLEGETPVRLAHIFRRLVTRWEYHIENFLGMVHLGCVKLLPRYL